MKTIRPKYNPILILSIVSLISIVYIISGLIIFKKQVFIERENLSLPEIFIGIGFGLILLSIIVSIIWLIRNPKFSGKPSRNKILPVALGILCLILLLGEKTMADEIGRESSIGWETLGEWIILYFFLFVQLFYILLIINLSRKKSSDK